jgi:hypothetical protein
MSSDDQILCLQGAFYISQNVHGWYQNRAYWKSVVLHAVRSISMIARQLQTEQLFSVRKCWYLPMATEWRLKITAHLPGESGYRLNADKR